MNIYGNIHELLCNIHKFGGIPPAERCTDRFKKRLSRFDVVQSLQILLF